MNTRCEKCGQDIDSSTAKHICSLYKTIPNEYCVHYFEFSHYENERIGSGTNCIQVARVICRKCGMMKNG